MLTIDTILEMQQELGRYKPEEDVAQLAVSPRVKRQLADMIPGETESLVGVSEGIGSLIGGIRVRVLPFLPDDKVYMIHADSESLDMTDEELTEFLLIGDTEFSYAIQIAS